MITAVPNKTKIAELSLDEINARLPLVESVVADISRYWIEILDARGELERAEERVEEGQATYRDQDRVDAIVDELNRLVDRVNGYIREIEQLGGTVQEYKRGVVSFPIKRGARTVLASWRRGEPAIGFFHEFHECFAQRRPL